jgi:hypothetical protein
VPLAQPKDGRNAFEVWLRFEGERSGKALEGMEGVARLEVGDRSLLWIGTRRIRDALRLWLWW